MASRTCRSRRHPDDLLARLTDAGIGFAIGTVLGVLSWVATVWWLMR